MANDNRAEIVLDGDVSPLRQKLREAGNSLKQFGTDAESSVSRVTGPLKMLQERFVAIGAILAGGAVFKEAVTQTAQLTEESIKLGRALGVSASEASILREALTAGNTSQEEFLGAAKGLAKQLRENEDGLQAMGLKTRDAAGQLRPLNDLVLEGIDVVNGYRAGTDRAIAGQAMFGKGFEMTSNLAEMNKKAVADVAEQMQALGIVASVESVAAWQAFDDAGDKAGLTMKALKVTIGSAVMPVLTKLGEWFSAIGPAAVVVIKGALGGLISLFWGLKTAAGMAFELINASVIQLTEPIRAVSVAFWKLIHGDFEGAKAEIANIPKVWSQGWNTAFDTIVKDATEARDKMWNLFADGTPAAKAGGGGKGATGLLKGDKEKKDKDAADPSFMAVYEARLAEIKNTYEQENVLRQFSKAQELAYWRELQQSYELTAKDRLAIAKRTATLEVEIRRQAAKEQRDLDQVMIDHRRSASLAQIQIEEQQARFAQENGEITKSALVAQEEEFARRRFEIEYQALLERLELAKSDPNTSPAELARIKEQLLDVECNYQMRRGELGQDKKKADGTGGLFDDIGSSFGSAANAMLTSARSLQQGLAGIFQSIYQSFIQNLIAKPLGEWIAAQARMLAIKLGFMAQEKTAETTASVASAAAKKVEGFVAVQANAAEAATGAAASQAMIPIVGPELALAAMASTYAAVTGFGLGALASASRGFDIPKGLNPLTQLHEEEMVLPQRYANVIRGMAQGSAGGGTESAAPVSVTIHALDASSVRDYFRRNSHALAPGLRSLARNFTSAKG